MNQNELITFLKDKTALSTGLSDEQLSLILKLSKITEVPKNTFIVREGEQGNELFILLDGEAEILKSDETGKEFQRISVINSGEMVGEMALIDNSPRSASVRVLKDSTILVLPLAKLTTLATQNTVYAQLMINLSKQLTQKLRKGNAITVKALQAELWGAKIRVEMGNFLFQILVVLSLWVFMVTIIKDYVYWLKGPGLISPIILIILTIISAFHIKKSIYPASFYGLNLNNWKKNISESIIFSLPILAIATAVKWWLITHKSAFMDLSLFKSSLVNKQSPIPPLIQMLMPLIYLIFTSIQEFLGRGSFQNSIEASLSGPHRVLWAIILSNLVFAAFHTHISFLFAVVAFISGLFWGWLYKRQRSLVGPCVSHALIGIWALAVLGLGDILARL